MRRATDEGGVLLEGVSKVFGTLRVLDDVSLRAGPGEVVAVVGPSGCGKSTLLELACGLQTPEAGTVQAAPAVLMPQRDSLLPWAGALDNAALPLRLKGQDRATARAGAHETFATFGLAGFEGARPHELSGGMRQRVAFLRTLLAGKPVLCLDEPFASLDALTRQELQTWLADALRTEPRTVLLVTHDVEEALVLADRVVVLSPRPATVRATLDVDLPRPRSRTGSRPRRHARARARGAGRVSAALLVLVFLGVWEVYARSGAVDDLILPAPTQIADAIGRDHRLLWDNFLVTASEVAVGLLAALVLGFGLAVTLHFSRTARRAVYPLLVGSQALPVVVIAPLLLVWLGFGLGPKVVIIALVCFFPIVVTTLDALRNVDADTLKLLRTMDATRWQAFRFAELPAAAPAALSGAKIAVAVSVIGAVFAEYAGSDSGLGHLILQAIPQLQTARAYAAVVILAALAVVLFYLLSAAERWLNPRTGGTPS